ncbi:MAG: hypothetical protein ACW99Q_23280, partial [Candidatus Kariarchaeaceae archaeon]
GDLKKLLVSGAFGDTLEKSWSLILKKGEITGDTTVIYIAEVSPVLYGHYLIHWNDRIVTTIEGDTSKTQAEWFTNEIVRVSGTTLPIGDTGDSHWFIIEPQESGTGYVYATAAQLEESTYPTPYVNGTRVQSSLAYTYTWGDSGALEFTARPRFDYEVGTNKWFLGDFVDASNRTIGCLYDQVTDKFRVALYDYSGSSITDMYFGVSDAGYIGDTAFASNTYLHDWHHFKIYWKFYGDSIAYGDTKIFKIFYNGNFVVGDSFGDSFTFENNIQLGSIPLFSTPAGFELDGELTDFLVWPNGDTTSTHYDNRVPYFYADPFPINTNWVYRVQTIDSNDQVSGDTTKSLQSNLFDSTLGTTWNSISGDSVLELGDSHDYRRNEYVVIDETFNSNGYYRITRTEDTNIFVTPNLTSGDITGKVYPTTSVVFVED